MVPGGTRLTMPDPPDLHQRYRARCSQCLGDQPLEAIEGPWSACLRILPHQERLGGGYSNDSEGVYISSRWDPPFSVLDGLKQQSSLQQPPWSSQGPTSSSRIIPVCHSVPVVEIDATRSVGDPSHPCSKGRVLHKAKRELHSGALNQCRKRSAIGIGPFQIAKYHHITCLSVTSHDLEPRILTA